MPYTICTHTAQNNYSRKCKSSDLLLRTKRKTKEIYRDTDAHEQKSPQTTPSKPRGDKRNSCHYGLRGTGVYSRRRRGGSEGGRGSVIMQSGEGAASRPYAGSKVPPIVSFPVAIVFQLRFQIDMDWPGVEDDFVKMSEDIPSSSASPTTTPFSSSGISSVVGSSGSGRSLPSHFSSSSTFS